MKKDPAYIYVLFKFGQQPSKDEAETLNAFTELFPQGFRIGYNNVKDKGLAIGFDADTFERVREKQYNFELLLKTWEKSGARISKRDEKVNFVSFPGMLRPRDRMEQSPKDEKVLRKDEKILLLRRLQNVSASEAMARISANLENLAIGTKAVIVLGMLGGTVYMGTLFYGAISKMTPRSKTQEDEINKILNPGVQQPSPIRKSSAEKVEADRSKKPEERSR